MKIDDIKVGDRLYDKWWKSWGKGTVTKVLKTRIHIKFPDDKEITVYDLANLALLVKK